MEQSTFQNWISQAENLTRGQRKSAIKVLDGTTEGADALAAIELAVDEDRTCPRCSTKGAVSRGKARGLRRYYCKGCGRTFNALTGTPLSGLGLKKKWLAFSETLADGDTIHESAERCGINPSTAFRWRHRFLEAARTSADRLKGIVEADETYLLKSRKGERKIGRPARRRGGKASKRGISREQVPVLMAADRSGTTMSAVLPAVTSKVLKDVLGPKIDKDVFLVSDGHSSYPPMAKDLGVSHETINFTAGERVRGDVHIQTVNSRHSRFKWFLSRYRGVATKYLDNYLRWFHLVGLERNPNSRTCLIAAMAR